MTIDVKGGEKIPGPAEWPWVGSIARMAENPAGYFLELAETYGPLAQFSFLGQRVVLVSDPALIREVLVERVDEFPKSPRDLALLSPYLGQGLLTNNGASHRQRRKLVQPAFHHKRIQGFGEIMVDYTEAMVAKWQDGEVLSVHDEMMRLTFYIVAKSLIKEDAAQMAHIADVVGEAVRELQEVVDEDFELPWLPPLSWPLPRSRRRRALQRVLQETFGGLIANRVANGAGEIEDRGDLLSMLLLSTDEEGNRLSHTEIRDEAITILLAGHETTSNALTWTFYLLGRHPEVMTKLLAEVDSVLGGRAPQLADLPQLTYTTQVVKEAMRLYPPAWVLNTRRVAQETTLGGYPLARGMDLFVSPYVMHHLGRFYDAPHEFRPERFTPEFEDGLPRFAYMPFGGGPRICIGNSFAMMEAQMILATICNRYVLERLPVTEAQLNAQITLSMKGGLQMRAVARQRDDGRETAGAQTELVGA